MSTEAIAAAPNSTWKLEVDTTGDGAEFTRVGGLNSFAATPNYSTADNTDFDSGLYGSDAVTQIKEQITATVLRRNDGSAYDAGQEAIRSAARKGEMLKVRYYDTAFDAAESYEATVSCQWAPQGGNGTALQSVNITLLVQGEPEEVPHPNAEEAPA